MELTEVVYIRRNVFLSNEQTGYLLDTYVNNVIQSVELHINA